MAPGGWPPPTAVLAVARLDPKAMILDSHLHLDACDPRVLERDDLATRPDWCALVPATHPAQTSAALARWGSDSRLRFCAGLHPWYLHHAAPDPAATLRALTALLDDPRVVAVGEVGLDRTRVGPKHADRAMAEQWVQQQAALASAYGLPLVLHVVGEHGRMQALLRTPPGRPLRGVVHAFVGTSMLAASWYRLGFVVGIGTMVLNKGATRLRETVANLPPDGFVLETDAPFLGAGQWAPGTVPPAALWQVAHEVARLRGTSVETVFAQSAQTAQAVFGPVWA